MTEPPVHVSTDEVHAHAHKTGHSKLDLIIAVTAIFISAVSLFVAIEHGRTERDLVAASSWPFIQQVVTNEYQNSRDRMAIGISNNGIGPAKVKSIEIFYNGQPVSSGPDLLSKCCGLRRDIPLMQQMPLGFESSSVDETVLRPGDDDAILLIHRDPTEPAIPDRFAEALHHISFRGCYCSVLDRCWDGDLISTKTTSVSECKPPEHPYDPTAR